jgi:hypothetical protein
LFGQEVTGRRAVRGDAEGPSLVRSRDEADEGLGPGVVHRREADLVEQDQIRLQYAFEHTADQVVGQSPIEGLDEFDAEVAAPGSPLR